MNKAANRFKIWKRSSVAAVCCVVVGFPMAAKAFDLKFYDQNFTQFRKDTRKLMEIPMENYFGLAFKEPDYKLSFDSNLQFGYDYKKHNRDFNLYTAVVHADKLWDTLSIDAGRQFLNEGFNVTIADALKFNISRPRYVDITLYCGIPRSVETGDFNRNDGLISGLNFHLKNVAHTEASVGVAWRKWDITKSSYRRNDTLLARASASHGFSVKGFNPYVYGLFEYDVSGKVINTATLGTTLYPHWRVSVDIDGSYLNGDRTQPAHETILDVYSIGRLVQGRAGVTVKIIDELSFTSGYSYQQYHSSVSHLTRANVADVGFVSQISDVGLTSRATYSLRQSLGGRSHGVSAFFKEDITDRIYASTYIAYANFKKVTNDNNWAITSVTKAGFEVVKGLVLTGCFEYNKNDVFRRDVRGTFQLGYVFDRHLGKDHSS